MKQTRRSDGTISVTSYNNATGDVLEGVPIILQPKRKSPFGRKFMFINQDFFESIADDRKEFTGEVFRVFYKLLSIMDYQNRIQVNQTVAAKEMGMFPSAFSKSIKKLIDMGIISRGNVTGIYHLDPNVAWEGKGSNHFEALNGAPK